MVYKRGAEPEQIEGKEAGNRNGRRSLISQQIAVVCASILLRLIQEATRYQAIQKSGGSSDIIAGVGK